MNRTPQRRMKLYNAACIQFLLLGFLTIVLVLCKFPLPAILLSAALCFMGLVIVVAFGMLLLWSSLMKNTWNKLLEKTRPPLVQNLEDGPMHVLKDSFTEVLSGCWTNNSIQLQDVCRSSPIPIPRREQQGQELELQKLPPATGFATRFLRRRGSHFQHPYRRSNSVPINCAKDHFCIDAKPSRKQTLSESAADSHFCLTSVLVESTEPTSHVFIEANKLQSLSENAVDESRFNLSSVLVEKTVPKTVISGDACQIELGEE